MGIAVRRHVAAGVALAGACAIALTPVAPPTPPAIVAPPTPPAIHAAKLDVWLAAAVTSAAGTIPTSAEVDEAIANGDVRNIPLNLLYALANVSFNETTAINQLAASLLYTGNWFVPSGTNVWGEDPADPGHFESIINVFNPFPAMSNIMGFQVAMIAAALLPASVSCDAEGCSPLTPVVPLTGITSLDRLIYSVEIIAGLRKFPLLNQWFSQQAFAGLTSAAGYTFPNGLYPSVSPGVGENGAIPTQTFTDSMGNEFTFVGTKVDENGQTVMPWAGTTFVWDPLLPWKAFYASLVSTPDTTGVYGTGIHVASPQDVIYSFQALLAGLVVDFNPFVPGSPFCPGACNTTLGITTPVIVKWISDLYPGNPILEKWLELEAAGQANGPTQEQIDTSIKILQTGFFTFDPATTAAINTWLAGIHPELVDIARDSGLLGGYNANALLQDIGVLTGISAGLADIGNRLGIDQTLQEIGGQLQVLDATLKDVGARVNATLTDLNARLNAALIDIGHQLGVDEVLKTVNAALWGVGALLNRIGSYPTPPSTENRLPSRTLDVSATSVPALTADSATTDGTAALAAPDSQLTNTVVGQVERKIRPVTEAAVDIEALPSNADPEASQAPAPVRKPVEAPEPTTATSTDATSTGLTVDRKKAVPDKADGGKADNPGGGKADNAGGGKADNAGGGKADNAGGKHRADNAGGKHRAA
ncbi:hypothetical protein [Mycobacterium sp. ACS1612]|uniref:hypothetical protein n=1 Tax=Mycobacterium sp. ACS1612 TaxID=1834117 RepID=UPI000A5D65BA|nr:hypothetical protein [Mycobacterium sp. ACS1612]